MIWVARRLDLIDRPGSAEHKRHHLATPTAGGLVILVAGGISVAMLPIELSMQDLGILSGTFLAALFGMLDDRFDLAPVYKLLGQFLAAAAIIALGVQVHITQIAWVDLILSILWLVGMTNAFNFVDSMDGLAVGLAGVASAFFMLVSIDSIQPELSLFSASLLGLMIGCFLFTSPPARMFLGDSGSQALGILLASIGIAYTPGQAGLPQGMTWFIPILALGVPIFDMSLVIVSRLRRGMPVYQANTDHLYHRMTLLGLHPNRSVLVMQIAAILLSLIAFLTLNAGILIANLIFAIVVLIGVIALVYLEAEYRKRER
jgi:UDP-GlcNAc:undecaprenyl-phosphate GlcNAc-1-phosphate transferase